MSSEANLNAESEKDFENEVSDMELALYEVDRVNKSKVEPLNKMDLEEIAENYDDIDFKELRTNAVAYLKLLGKGKDLDKEGRKALIDKILGKETEEPEEVEVQEEKEESQSSYEDALGEVYKIRKDPNMQLTNAKLQEISLNHSLDFATLKEKVKNMSMEDYEEAGDSEQDKEQKLEEIKEMYLNRPNELTKEAITERGFTTDEIKDMITQWREEKKKALRDD